MLTIILKGGASGPDGRTRRIKEVAMAMQLALPLETDTRMEAPLRLAWARSGLALPYERALQDRAIAICLRCLADAMRRNKRRKRRG
jgi:hypothetical protein